MSKKRVLLLAEPPHSPTGYGVMASEFLGRLAATNKYELALLACSGIYDDLEYLDLPYRVFSNVPNPSLPAEAEVYKTSASQHHGAFRFHQVCREFRPDIVWSFRDFAVDEFLERSPYRPFYRLALMATVDATPMPPEIGALYGRLDACLTYTKWGADVLSPHGVRVVGQAPPAADYNTFQPVQNRAALRESIGLPGDALVLGMVSRNQQRKRFPDLATMFAKLVASLPEAEAARAVLYLHTGYPDDAWDIPRILRDAGILNRTYLSYSCLSCNAWWASRFVGARAPCRACGVSNATPVSVLRGLERPALGRVFASMDAHVLYSNSEGFGMTALEAAACGVAGFATDYSASGEVIRAVGGIPIPVVRLVTEPHFHGQSAYPDNERAVELLREFLLRPESVRRAQGFAQRSAAMSVYSYDRSAAVWESVFDQLPLAKPWDSPRRQAVIPGVPNNLDDAAFARFIVGHATQRADYANGYPAARMVRDLSIGITKGWFGGVIGNPCDIGAQSGTNYNRTVAMAEGHSTAGVFNSLEEHRCVE